MIKLQDFARQQGVTDRAVQKILKKYESELEGLFERKGTNGTWLSDEACSVLRSKMKAQPTDIYDDSKVREIERMKDRIKELEERMERKDVLIEKLQARVEEKTVCIEEMKKEQLLLEEKTADKVKAAEDALKNKLQEEFNEQIATERTRRLTFGEAMKRVFGKNEV